MSMGNKNSLVGLVRSSELEQFRISINNKETNSMIKAIELRKKGLKVFWIKNYQIRYKYWNYKEWIISNRKVKFWIFHKWSRSGNNKPLVIYTEICLLGFTIGYLKY
jgi:hypothetical protein